MNDISGRLELLGRIEPPPDLDARIESLICRAEAGSSARGSRTRRARILVAVGVLSLAVGLTVAMLLRGENSRTPTPPQISVDLPLTPGLGRLLRPEPHSRPPFFHQRFAEVKIVYVAGSPSRPAPGTQ